MGTIMQVTVDVYAKAGAKGDKIWCGYSAGGSEFAAFGPSNLWNVAAAQPNSLNFGQLASVKGGSLLERVSKKEKSGYKLVGSYLLDTELKVAVRAPRATAVPPQPKVVKQPMPKRPAMALKLRGGVVWAW